MNSTRIVTYGRLGNEVREKLYLGKKGELVGTLFVKEIYPHKVVVYTEQGRPARRGEKLQYTEKLNWQITKTEVRKAK